MIVPLTVEYLHEILNYDPLTGVFTWRVSHHRIKAGQEAGCLSLTRYRRIMVDRKGYLAHRLAWLYVHGVMPPQDLDHINGNPADNRIANLRLCDKVLNAENRSLNGFGATGYLGVTFNKLRQKFQAKIGSQGVRKHLGYFSTALEASQAYVIAKKTIHTFQGWAE